MTRRRRTLAACLLSGPLLLACADLVGIPSVELAPQLGDAAVSSDGESVDAGGCGRTLADGATRAGPEMVRIDVPSAQRSYCIDTTEVTVAQYNEFLFDDAGGALIDAPSACYNPAAKPSPLANSDPDAQNLPMGGLGECFAWSYCLWAHKRLCGSIGDAGLVVIYNEPEDTEWGYACVGGVHHLAYPYGAAYEDGACALGEDASGPVPVKSRKSCHGTMPPFDQIYDMVGNVWEFQYDLQGNGDAVYGIGGAWSSGGSGTDCFSGNGFNGINYYFGQSGFRCCADPEP